MDSPFRRQKESVVANRVDYDYRLAPGYDSIPNSHFNQGMRLDNHTRESIYRGVARRRDLPSFGPDMYAGHDLSTHLPGYTISTEEEVEIDLAPDFPKLRMAQAGQLASTTRSLAQLSLADRLQNGLEVVEIGVMQEDPGHPIGMFEGHANRVEGSLY